ncbi:MAG: putative ABC transporter permease [Anaerococcus sp.]
MQLEVFSNYIFIFFIFSVIGWLIEVGLKFIELHRFVNRGFFVGPYCPIYGLGSLLILITTNGLDKYEHSFSLVFLTSVFVCGLVEYLVSYFLEKIYHARWWDYTNRPMNLNGRIWVGNLILFGIGGLLIVETFNPMFMSLFYKFDLVYREYFALFIIILMFSDYMISYFVMNLIKINIEQSNADNTEDIKNEMKLLARNKNILYSRFINAYPEVKYRTDKIKIRLREIERETKKFREEIEKTLNEQKQTLKNDIMPMNFIKNQIIDNQERLIDLLENENSSKEEILRLKEEIKNKKEVLNKRKKLLKIDSIDN